MTTLIHAPHSATSRAAAIAAQPKVPNQRERVFQAIEMYSGLTRDEISDVVRIPLASVCARVAELLSLERVCESKDTRPTKAGKAGAVLVVAGPKEIEQGRLL